MVGSFLLVSNLNKSLICTFFHFFVVTLHRIVEKMINRIELKVMSKSVLLFTLLFCVPTFLLADPITKSQARAKAEKVLSSSKGGEVVLKDLDLSSSLKSKSTSIVASPAFYAFNSSDGNGFVLVSGDDDFPEIIAYSDSGSFDSEESMSPSLVSFLESYSEYVNDVRNGDADAPLLTSNASVTADESSVVVGPFCTTRWGQRTPYNYYCPVISGDTCYVGCVATAMAQIMRYWEFPERATGYVSYDTGTEAGVISEDLSSDVHVYDWDNMYNTSAPNRQEVSRSAVARLNYDCGVASRMAYNVNGSGTYVFYALKAFHTNFYYNASTLDVLYANYFATGEEWHEVIKKELDNGCPVLMHAADANALSDDHAFIVDGYDSNGYVHVNWGWFGNGNGYYDLSILFITPYEFSENQYAIVGITPGTGSETRLQERFAMNANLSVKEDSSVSRNSTFTFVASGNFINNYADSHKWSIGVGLYDKSGEFLEMINTNTKTFEIDSNVMQTSYNALTCQIPDSYEEGDYVLKLMMQDEGYNEWILPYIIGGEALNAIPVYVTSSSLNFNEVSTPVASVEEEAKAVVNHEYFDMSGRRVEEIEDGSLGIDRQTLEDGSVRSEKILR